MHAIHLTFPELSGLSSKEGAPESLSAFLGGGRDGRAFRVKKKGSVEELAMKVVVGDEMKVD